MKAFWLILLSLNFSFMSAQVESDTKINGADDIVSKVQQSINSISYLRCGSVKGGFSYYAAIQPGGIFYFLKGKMSVDYFDITMPDGKVFRYNWNESRKGFTNNQLPDGYISHIQINHLAIKISSAKSLGKNLQLSNSTSAFPLYGEPKSSNVYGNIPYNELQAYGTTKDQNGNIIYAGTPEEMQKIVAAKPFVSISCSGLEDLAYKNLKDDVNWIRDAYTKHQESNNSNNKSSSTANRGSNSNSGYSSQNYSNRNTSQSSNRTYSNNDKLVNQGYAINQQSKAMEKSIYQAADNINSIFDKNIERINKESEEREEREWEEEQRQKREDEARWRREEAERQRLEAERKRKEEEKARRYTSRSAIISKHPQGVLPTSSIRANTNKLYYFVYAYSGSLNDESPTLYISNVFAIGQYPDGTWPMQNLVLNEINSLTTYTETTHGYYTTKQEADLALSNFKASLSGTGMTINDIIYSGKNADVAKHTKGSNNAETDYWGNPVKKSTATKTKTTPQKQPQQKKEQKLDFWGNPIKE